MPNGFEANSREELIPHSCLSDYLFARKLQYSRASLIRTLWDSGMFGLVNFRINWVLQNTRGVGDSRALSSEGHNQGRVTM
jgi:hypothetical protein